MTAVSAKASGPSAAAAPASVRSCSWSPLSPPNTTRPLQSPATDCSPLEKKKWSSESLSPTNCSSASTQKHAMRVHNTPMQLDTSDSRSPQRSPREERGEGEVIDRRSCLNLNSSRFSCCQELLPRCLPACRNDKPRRDGSSFAGTTEAIGCLKIEDGLLGR